MIFLETARLILRDYTPADAACYYRLKSHDKTMYYLQDIMLRSPSEADEDFAGLLGDMESPNRAFYFLHIEDRITQEQLGSAGFTVTDRTPVGALVHAGYFIYPEFWSKGYMTESFARVLEFAFSEQGVYRVTTGCLKENVGSERVMQKCGMICEGERVDWEWHDGAMKTRMEYRLLRREWEAVRMRAADHKI